MNFAAFEFDFGGFFSLFWNVLEPPVPYKQLPAAAHTNVSKMVARIQENASKTFIVWGFLCHLLQDAW